MIKMIVTDMDGTLLGSHGLTERTAKAIAKIVDSGVEFAVATGRDLSGVKGIFEEKNLPFSAILGNGAQFCNRSGEIVKTAYLNKARFKEIIQIFDEEEIHYMIFCHDGFFSIQQPEEVAEAFIKRGMHRFKRTRKQVLANWANSPMPCMMLKKIASVNDFLKADHEIIKVEAFDIDESKIARAKARLVNIEGIAYLSSFPDNVEVTDINAQKGLILREVIAQMGISADEVAVFGDGMNDITLFEQFPYSFAVENADPEIKRRAYRIIPSNEEDGVAWMIDEMIKAGLEII